MGRNSIRVAAYKDEFPLAVTVFTPIVSRTDAAKIVVVLNNATGVTQNFYSAFASWLAKEGIAAVTWDYRYTGDSMPSNIELPASQKTRVEVIKYPDAANINISDHWARRDQPAVIEYIVNQFKGYKLVIIGHSLGSHIIALLPEHLRSKIHRAVFVAGNNPNWQLAPKEFIPKMRSIWQATYDSIQREGYLSPEGSIFGITIPAGAAIEWTTNIIGDDKRYLAGYPDLQPFYDSWQPVNEIISIAFKDDITLFSRNQTVPLDAWCEVFTKAKMTRVLVTPEQYGKKEVGHVGMFKDGQSEIWEMFRDIIVDGKIPDKGDIRRWNQGKARL